MELTDCMLRLLGTAKAMDVKYGSGNAQNALLTYCHHTLHVLQDISQKIQVQQLHDAGISFFNSKPIPRQMTTTISRASNVSFPSLPQSLPIVPAPKTKKPREQKQDLEITSTPSTITKDVHDPHLQDLISTLTQFSSFFQTKRLNVWTLNLKSSANIIQNIHSLKTRRYEEYVFHFKINDPTHKFTFNLYYKTLPSEIETLKTFITSLIPGILPFLRLENLPPLSFLLPSHLFPVILNPDNKTLINFAAQTFNLTQNAFINHENTLFQIPFDDENNTPSHKDYPLQKTWKYRYNPTYTPPYHYTYPLIPGYLNIIEQSTFNRVSQPLHEAVPYVFIPSSLQNIILKRIKNGVKIQAFIPWGTVYVNSEPLGYLTNLLISMNLKHSVFNEILATKQHYTTPLTHTYGYYHGSSFLIHKSLIKVQQYK